MSPRLRNTPEELVLCTYAARYDASDFGGVDLIYALGYRSAASIKMKIQNIAAMLDEERIPRESDIKPLSGRPPGESGRRTDWDVVSQLVNLSKEVHLKRCLAIISGSQCTPCEESETTVFREGSVRKVVVNSYERDPRARAVCIQKYGSRCSICEFNFGSTFGKDFEGFIHVHHLRPLAEIGEEYSLNPLEDLRPVCPNCHAAIHIGGVTRSIEEVKELIERNRI